MTSSSEMKEKSSLIEELLRAGQTVEEVDFKTMVDLVESCNAVNPSPVHRKSRKLASEALTDSLTSVLQPIFPGKATILHNVLVKSHCQVFVKLGPSSQDFDLLTYRHKMVWCG